MSGMLALTEDETYYFDAEAGERPIRFIEKFCVHFEGRFVGQPFLLHDIQKRIIRDVYGWKVRATGLRRFTDVYWEGAVGAGKSPLLAGLGLYGLMADGEAGAQVYSLASTFGQAAIVYDIARKFVELSVPLSRCLQLLQYRIKYPPTQSFWRMVSGKGPGAGCNPSLVLGDELHEWPNAGGYDALRTRMVKRTQPLFWTATNPGESQFSFCWYLREKAVSVLRGGGSPTLYPIIWSAIDPALPAAEAKEVEKTVGTDDPAAWRRANPLLGTTVEESKIAQRVANGKDDQVANAKLRKDVLAIWPSGTAGRWLNMSAWDECCAPLQIPAGAVPYVGMDLAESDDLCAIVFVWVTREHHYVDAHFWIPRVTAERYEKQHAIAYSRWAEAGWITLLDGPTVDSAARLSFVNFVVGVHEVFPVAGVFYDRAKADETVAVLEAAKITCVPIAQGWTTSPGCNELDRRIKERSATFTPNPVLRFCAENATVEQDRRGNISITKPMAKGKYAGTPWQKVDGISALVTAETVAKKHNFPAVKNEWTGTIAII